MKHNYWNGKNTIHGSAEWLTGWRKRKLLNTRNKGLCVDGVNRIDLKRSFTHMLVVAPTGSGKSTTVVLPLLLRLKGEMNPIVFDPSGELRDKSKGYLQHQGYDVLEFNVQDTSQSVQFNPLAFCQDSSDINRVAESVVINSLGNNTNDSFWNDSAKSIIALLITALLKPSQSAFQPNLYEVYQMLSRIGVEQPVVDTLMAEHLSEDEFRQYKAFVVLSDKVKSSVVATARTALSKLTDQNIQTLTNENTLDIGLFRSKKTALFLIVPEHKIQYYSFLMSLLYEALFDAFMELPKPKQTYRPIVALMDEFANSARLSSIANIVSTIRKRKVSIVIVLQNIQQLEALYGRNEAAVIISNLASKVFFPGLPIQDCRMISDMLGAKTETYSEDQTSAWWPSNKPQRSVGRKLLNPDEVRQLPNHQAIYFYQNMPPVLLRLKPWYKQWKLRRRSKINSK